MNMPTASVIYEKLNRLEREVQHLKMQTYRTLPRSQPLKVRSRADIHAWRAAAGILKGRRTPDPVAWQRKIRKEWERKLP